MIATVPAEDNGFSTGALYQFVLSITDFPQLQKQPLASQCCTNISCLHICFEPINLSCSIKADLVLLICPRFCVKPVCIWYCLSASGTACLHLVLPALRTVTLVPQEVSWRKSLVTRPCLASHY